MNKKAVFFTFTTVLLLSPLFVLTKTYLDRSKEMQKIVTYSAVGDKFRYIEDDVIGNIYSDLLWLNVSSVRREGLELVIDFSRAGRVGLSVNHTKIFDDYKDFIEGNYSNMHKLDITLNDFDPEFDLGVYGRFVYDVNELYVYNDRNRLNSIVIEITANASTIVSNTTPDDDGGSNPEINLIVNDKDGVQLYDETRQQDPDEKDDFEFIFEDDKNLTVSFGLIDSTAATLLVADDLYTEITGLELRYDAGQKLLATSDANLIVSSDIESVVKNTDFILLEE